jgi:hypothetical protein
MWALYSPNRLSYGLYKILVSSEQRVRRGRRSKELSVGCEMTDRDIKKIKRFRGHCQQKATAGKSKIKKCICRSSNCNMTNGSSNPGLVA